MSGTPAPRRARLASLGDVGRGAVTIAGWTAVSRATGFLRVVAISVVLGPTFLGNTFQSLNVVPNLAFELLAGSLFGNLLVPRLLRGLDAGDRATTQRIAGGFLGGVLAGGLLVAVLIVLCGPALLGALGAGVAESEVREDQRRLGWELLPLLAPQVMLYGVAGVAGAVMNAHGRFALPAAAPVLENVGLIITMAVVAVAFGTDASLAAVPRAELLVLGLGATGAVGLHALVVCWGASRCGTSLRPRAGWRDPEVRAIFRVLVPSLGFTGMSALRLFVALIAANVVAGGVIAFTIAQQLVWLPVALASRPIAVALLPRLARLHRGGPEARFRDELIRSYAATLFFTVPAAIGCLVLATPVARAASFGAMATETGVALTAAALSGMALVVIGEAAAMLGTNAAYAREDARGPFLATAVQTIIAALGILAAVLLTDGDDLLLALGAALSLGSLMAAGLLGRRLLRGLPRGREMLLPSIVRTLAASALAAVPAYICADVLQSRVGDLVGMLVAGTVGAAVFFAVQLALRSPELRFLVETLRRGDGHAGV